MNMSSRNGVVTPSIGANPEQTDRAGAGFVEDDTACEPAGMMWATLRSVAIEFARLLRY